MAPKMKPIKQGMMWAKTRGKPVEDASERLEVRLTPADIRGGKPMNQTGCAFAKGIERQEEAAAAWVGMSMAFVEWEDKVLRYEVPESVSRELVSFDRAHLAEIGTFHLRPPAPTNTLSARRKPSPRKAKGKPRRVESTHLTANVRHG